jgi:hypothetical protein
MSNVEDITSNDNIDPEDISYISDIQPIFNGSCGGSGCHVGSSNSGVNLSNYSAVMNSIGSNYDSKIVVAGSPDQSPLVDKIEANPDKGSRMPLGRSPLSPTEIETIRAWITGGAKDN